MGKIIHQDTLLSYIKSLEKRIAVLETQQRLQAARISSGQLNIGAASAVNQIELDATNRRIRFDTATSPADIIGSTAGLQLFSTQDVGTFPFATRAIIWDGPYFTTLQASRIDDDIVTTHAEIYADVQDSGGGNSRGTVNLTARGEGDSNGSQISLWADGGVRVYSNGRTTDPPAPPTDWVVLYVKGNRLYYKDASNVVHGPL